MVSKLEGKLRIQPTLKCGEALDYFEQEFGVHIEVTKMWRAMKEAKQLVEGNERKQYVKVFDYAHELLRSNPGSTQCQVQKVHHNFRGYIFVLLAVKRGLLLDVNHS